jgi:hypothetical protein
MFNTRLGGIITGRLPMKERGVVMDVLQKANPMEVDTMIYNLDIAIKEAMEKAEQNGMNKGITEGKAEGMITAILNLLELHGTVDEELHASMLKETDSLTLTRWVRLAARVHSIEEFEAEMSIPQD